MCSILFGIRARARSWPKSAVQGPRTRIFRGCLCLGWQLDEVPSSHGPAHRRPRGAALLRGFRRGDDRHLPQRHGIAGPAQAAGQALRAQLLPGRSGRGFADHGRQAHRLLLVPHAATERLLSGTPASLQRQAFLGVELRAGGGAKYQLLVFPRRRKAQLIKVTGSETKYLKIDKNDPAIVGVNQANVLRLRAVNVTSGPEKGQARLFAYVGPTLVAEAVDEAAGELSGRASTVIVGAPKNGNGVIASVDDVVVRVPSPF
jgi:hypothetical protein